MYHVRVRERTVAEWFLDEQGKRLGPAERSWIRAQAGAWLSVWEVRAVDPGAGLELEDLLTGERLSVREASASAMLVARDAVLGRVVDHGGLAVLCGVHTRALPPAEAAEVARRVRSRLRLKRAVPPERLAVGWDRRHLDESLMPDPHLGDTNGRAAVADPWIGSAAQGDAVSIR